MRHRLVTNYSYQEEIPKTAPHNCPNQLDHSPLIHFSAAQMPPQPLTISHTSLHRIRLHQDRISNSIKICRSRSIISNTYWLRVN